MFPNTTRQVVRHTGVKNDSSSIGHHIDIVGVHCNREVPRRPLAARDDSMGG
jgi:hypothetical protein